VDERAAELESGARFEERYEVEVGRGGMGVVLRVFDRRLRRRLAMKVLRHEGGDARGSSALARFLEEAQITAQLGYPGIVPVHDVGRDPHGHGLGDRPSRARRRGRRREGARHHRTAQRARDPHARGGRDRHALVEEAEEGSPVRAKLAAELAASRAAAGENE